MPSECARSSLPAGDEARDEVLHVAEAVRSALQRLSDDRHPVIARIENSISRCRPTVPVTFPRNWCDYASCVLALQIARFIEDSAIDLCVWNEDGVLHSHWWLRFRGFDIDITADQYDGIEESVIVERASPVHARRFADPTARPFLSRLRQAMYFECLVNRLDAELDQQLASERVVHSATRCRSRGHSDEE